MNPSDDRLMAYADGVLPPAEAAQVEAALAADPGLRRRVDEHRALRAAVAAAYEAAANEPVPQRLIDAAGSRHGRGLPVWTALAAAIVAGVLAGAGGWSLGQRGLTGGPGGLEARGALKAELDNGLASAARRADGVARVGLTYRTAEGYCRTFAVSDQRPWAGVACRGDNAWIIQTAVRTAPDAAAPSAYRQAASSLPAPVLQTMEAAMVGEPLDAAQEAAAMAGGWRLAVKP
jgi:hypothetical protein